MISLRKVMVFTKKGLRETYFLNRVSRALFSFLPVVFRESIARRSEAPFSKLEKENGFVFIHIPKCAGNAVIGSLYGEKGTGHATVMQYVKADPSRFNSSFKFAVVREPLSRFVSAFQYLKKGGMGGYDIEFSNKYLKDISNVDEFIERIYSDASYRRKVFSWTHFIPQKDFLLYDGVIAVDMCIQQEHLESEFGLLAERLGRPGCKLQVLNKTGNEEVSIKEKNADFVKELYRQDYVLLGYCL